MLTDVSYTRAVDWWGLGVLIYEMLVGEVSNDQFVKAYLRIGILIHICKINMACYTLVLP